MFETVQEITNDNRNGPYFFLQCKVPGINQVNICVR